MVEHAPHHLMTEVCSLGKKSAYLSHYAPELLFSISRLGKRDEIGVSTPLPFYGFDTWNAYEVSWLNSRGKPIVALAQFDFSCFSTNIIESKSFKLYLNSMNQSSFKDMPTVRSMLERDLQLAVGGEVQVQLFGLEECPSVKLTPFQGELLDEMDVACDMYTVHPEYLSSDPADLVKASLYSNLLKSNCLVTGQPDWGSVRVDYEGPSIHKEGLLKYIVSFRDHPEFHEQCVERLFMDILKYCKPEHLTVEARYTRRGGLDINPIRSTSPLVPADNIRMPRQ